MSPKLKMTIEAIPMISLFLLSCIYASPLWFLAAFVYTVLYGYRWSED